MGDRGDRVELFLRGQALLATLLAAALALFLCTPALRTVWTLPELRLVLATVYAGAGGLVALLTATRLSVEGRRFDLLLCGGALLTGASWLCFAVVPALAGAPAHQTELWAAVAGRVAGWGAIAAAPFVGGRVRRRRHAPLHVALACAAGLAVSWLLSRQLGGSLPRLGVGRVPAPLMGALAAQALVHLLAVIGYSDRYRTRGEDLDRWLALASTLMLFASLHFIFTPHVGAGDVSQGDFLQVVAYGVLLAGVWRAIRASEFGRAIAEERSRVAREIHDGLAQYLFAISTNVALLEAGVDAATTLPLLREAATAAQQEARYAVLALSSAAGRSPFDTALRRYVELLAADGVLDVELTVDPDVRLTPDEQIEIFRIVQEGLANARRHAGARRAWVEVAGRGRDRVVSVRDDGAGFEPAVAPAGQGLRNMRDRAASIGAALTLRSAPGTGTAVEVVLRA